MHTVRLSLQAAPGSSCNPELQCPAPLTVEQRRPSLASNLGIPTIANVSAMWTNYLSGYRIIGISLVHNRPGTLHILVDHERGLGT